MKTKIKKLLLFLIIGSLFVILPYYLISGRDSKKADAVTAPNAYMKFDHFDPTAKLGSASNPFIILEIVPYRGMGQIGYIIGGQEPVDPAISTPQNNKNGEFDGYAKGAYTVESFKENRIDPKDKDKYIWISSTLSGQNGYFSKVTGQTGLYDKKTDGTNICFIRNQWGTGEYNWVSSVNKDNIPTDYNSDTVWMNADYKLDVSYWQKKDDWKLVNTEIFKRKVLLLKEEEIKDYQVRVVTITPDELNRNVEKFTKYYDLEERGKNNKITGGTNTEGEIDLIGNADLISISPKAHAGDGLITLWENYGRDKSGISTAYDRKTEGFAKTDFTWQTTLELFMKIGVVDDSAAFIYDINCFDNGSIVPSKNDIQSMVPDGKGMGFTNNIFKLILMLRQQDPIQFYNLYLNTNGGTEKPLITTATVKSNIPNNNNTTGSFRVQTTDDAKIYWNKFTFLPAYPNGKYPAYLSENNGAYKNYLNSQQFLVDYIAGDCREGVIRNTFFYNGTSSVVQYFITRQTIQSNTYTPYQYNSELFDYLFDKAKKTNSNASRPTTAAPCDAVEYILRYKKSEIMKKSHIQILDLEPCNDYTLTVEAVRQMLPSYTGTIGITQQTTAEFIGKTEDLNHTYDLIFIGTKTGKMNTSGGSTIYNDPMMDGLIYSHVGDRVVAFDNFKGILKSKISIVKAFDSLKFSGSEKEIQDNVFKGYTAFGFRSILPNADFYRYSGNDITDLKKQKLQEYIDAGFPILLENDLYTCNKTILDDSSNLYQFLNQNKTNNTYSNFMNKGVFAETSTSASAKKHLLKLVSGERLSLTIETRPAEFNVNDSATLIKDRTLNFKFSINPPSDSGKEDLYHWKIYADGNADGKFTAKEVIASDISRAGVPIQETKRLSDRYAGVIPWKLEVKSTVNTNIRTEKTGFAAFKVYMSDTEKLKTQINILQVTSNHSTLNLQELMNPSTGRTSLFYKYTSNLDDFNVKITTINVKQLLSRYSGAGNKYDTNNPEETDKLYFTENGIKKSYDMLIFGFGDCYSDIDNTNGALNNIQDFMDSGRSVMFTHDTTSFVNMQTPDFYNNKGLTYWGYGFNQYLRNRVGLDRFGILKEAGDTTPYDIATMPGKVNKSFYQDSKITAYPEIQGLTYGTIVGFGNPGSNAMVSIYDANKAYPPFSTGNTIEKGTAIDNYLTNFVTKVNDGQITNYPYKIPDGFAISTTHNQYYQLNMEDPDVVVWYCLSDSKSKKYSGNQDNNAYTYKNETGPYSTSPNDVRNNYYIYSKDNIMYTGVGHSSIDRIVNESQIDDPKYAQNVNEVKLFINTMIASYHAGVTPPKVQITNEEAIQNNTQDYIIYKDLDGITDTAGLTGRIKFIPEDTNLLSENLIARIYYYDSKGNPVLINPQVKAKSGTDAEEYNHSGLEPGYIVKNGREYYFDFPLTNFIINGTDKVSITVTNEENLKGSAVAQFLGRSLFDLD